MPYYYGRRRRYTGRYIRRLPIRRRSYTTKRSYGKGVLRRRYHTRRFGKAMVLRSPWGTTIPNTSYVKFKYIDDGWGTTLNSGNSYRYTQLFRGNSPYDPDYTGVGVQPYGWDQWTALYGQYTCVASAIRIYFTNSSLENTLPALRVFLIPSRSTSFSYTEPSDESATKWSKQVTFNMGDSSSKQKLKHYMRTKLMYPIFNKANNNFTAAYNADPSFQWYWHVIFDSSEWSIETTFKVSVKIVYYVILSNPVQVNES